MELFHWTLKDIDETDIESLIPFVFEYPAWKARQKTGGTNKTEITADQADWL